MRRVRDESVVLCEKVPITIFGSSFFLAGGRALGPCGRLQLAVDVYTVRDGAIEIGLPKSVGLDF